MVFIVLDYVAGIDGGATKTICIVADNDGKVLGRDVSGLSHYHNVSSSAVKKALPQSIKRAASNTRLGRLRFKAAYFDMAGLDSPYDRKAIPKLIREEIKKIMPKARLASPKFEPAMGAVLLALRELSEEEVAFLKLPKALIEFDFQTLSIGVSVQVWSIHSTVHT